MPVEQLCPLICPTGSLVVRLSSPFAKIFCFAFTPNHIYNPRRSVPEEGRWPSSRTLGRDAVDAAASGGRGHFCSGSLAGAFLERACQSLVPAFRQRSPPRLLP